MLAFEQLRTQTQIQTIYMVVACKAADKQINNNNKQQRTTNNNDDGDDDA